MIRNKKFNYKTVQLTDAHLGRLIPTLLADFKVKKTEGELKAGRKDVGYETAKGYHPTPTPFRVVVLPKCCGFAVVPQC